MILHQSSIIKLEYNPTTDILEVEYPDLEKFMLSEIRHALTLMVETIRNYDVKRLLLDASKTSVNVSEEENTQLTLQLAKDLATTRLQKLARITPSNQYREIKAQENINQAKQSGAMPYLLESFTNRAIAIEWLVRD